MKVVDWEYKNIVVRIDYSGNVVFEACLKDVRKVNVDIDNNCLSIELNNGFTNTYPMANHDPFSNYNFSIQ